MKKLFVDDIRNAPDDSWFVCRTVTSAIRTLAQFDNFDEISLDHDISHQVHMDTLSRPYPCSETFQPVAHFIGVKYLNKVFAPAITLHTSNPVGAKELQDILKEYGLSCTIRMYGSASRLDMEAR